MDDRRGNSDNGLRKNFAIRYNWHRSVILFLGSKKG
jgi:hypothetical protein